MKKVIYCSVCKKPLTGRQALFCSTRCKNHVHQSYGAQKERALERKLHFIKSMGGKCVRCGYNENLAALSFHHRGGKEYELDARSLSNRGFGDMAEEIAKCDLLCANCHMELHHPHLDVAKLSIEPTALTTELQARMTRERSAQRDTAMIIAENAPFEKKFTENLAHCGVKSGQTIVLGVSGGVDSVTMLNLFVKSELKLNIIVAHVNHNARPDSDDDEILVKNLATKYGYIFATTKLNPSNNHSHIRKNTRIVGNVENYFRDERRKFLLNVANDNKAKYVALAHNANDQAETFIMHAVRGSGPAGLGGMKMTEDNIIRPLLNISRVEIANYAVANKLAWHEDTTNKDISYDRNYVRHRILPLLARLNPEYLSVMGRTTHLQRQIDEHFKEEAYRLMQNPTTENLHHLDKPLLYEVLGLLYEEAKGDRQNLSLMHLTKIEDLLGSKVGTKTLDLPENIVVRRRYDKLDFYRKSAHNTPSTPRTINLEIGEQMFGEWKVTISNQQSATNNKHTLTIDTNMLPNLQLRTKLPGDKIAKIGLNGTKKLQDLFVDAKIDRVDRNTWPILVNKITGEILWVPGLATAKIVTKSKKLLTINITRGDI